MANTAHPLSLPPTLSPDSLDALSELSIILAKVRVNIQTSSGITTGATPNPAALSGQQISFKDVPGATDSLKHKLQHAKRQVGELPDMNRTVEQQHREIAELEARIKTQRALLTRLREDGVSFGKDADKMDI